MVKIEKILRFGLIISLIVHNAPLFAQAKEELQGRRKAVIAKMQPSSVMILRSTGSFGTFHTERQDGNFYYLTGINEPDAYLILHSQPELDRSAEERFSRMGFGKEVLFVTPQNPNLADWDAMPLGIKAAKERLRFQDVRPSTEFSAYFDRLLLGNFDVVYMDYQHSDRLLDPLTDDEQILNMAREKGATFRLKSPSQILAEMGRIRSKSEISLIKQAVDITSEAQIAAMCSIKPGMYEYQLQAIIEYVYTLNGAQRSAFPSIIGSGPNSCVLHWELNSRKMVTGDLVVVDIGAEYKLYGADITRTIPINGKFNQRQREVYEIVLAANTAGIEMVAPGIKFEDISKKAAEVVGEGLVKLGLIKDKSEFRQYYFHGLGHPIGLRVGGRTPMGTLEPGMVITIEPGIYIREEGLGVRIEDDVLVTQDGHEVLSQRVPKTIPAIEKLMQKKGMDHTRYLLESKRK